MHGRSAPCSLQMSKVGLSVSMGQLKHKTSYATAAGRHRKSTPSKRASISFRTCSRDTLINYIRIHYNTYIPLASHPSHHLALPCITSHQLRILANQNQNRSHSPPHIQSSRQKGRRVVNLSNVEIILRLKEHKDVWGHSLG